MSIATNYSDDGASVTIAVINRFDFNVHKEFRDAYEKVPDKSIQYVIDLKQTDYIDSSALGMLLLLREFAGGDKANIKIVNCSSDLKNILSISNFQHLFNIV